MFHRLWDSRPPNNRPAKEIWGTQSRCRPGCSIINVELFHLLHLCCWARWSRPGGWGEAVQRQEGANHRRNYILWDPVRVVIISSVARAAQSPKPVRRSRLKVCRTIRNFNVGFCHKMTTWFNQFATMVTVVMPMWSNYKPDNKTGAAVETRTE